MLTRTHIFLLAGLMALFSCNNPCKDVVCNNGTCFGEGECECDSGYEGENCDISSNTKFDGTYTMTELCDSSAVLPGYSVTVGPKPGTTNLFTVTGLHGSLTSLEARVEDDGVAFSLARQDLGGGLEIASIAGTISMDAATINLNYQVFQGSSETVMDRCSGSMIK